MDEYEKKWSEAFSRQNGSREKGWVTNAEARRMSEEQRKPSGSQNLPAVISNSRRPRGRSLSGSRGIKIVGGNEPELKFDDVVDAEFVEIKNEPYEPHISPKSQKKSGNKEPSKQVIDAKYEVMKEPSKKKYEKVKSDRVKSHQKSKSKYETVQGPTIQYDKSGPHIKKSGNKEPSKELVKSGSKALITIEKEPEKSRKGLVQKYVTKSNARKVNKFVGAVAKAAGGVVGETAKAIGDANLAHAQAHAIRNGMYAPGEKTKRVYYYPDGTVKEVVETQKPGDIRKGGTADKKPLGPGNLGPKANAQARGKPGPGRRQATLGRRSAKTIGKNQVDMVKVQNGLGGGRQKDGPVNKPKGGPGRKQGTLGTGNKGGPGVRREVLGVRSKKGPTNNANKGGPKRRSGYKPPVNVEKAGPGTNTNKGAPTVRSGYKPVGKRRSVNFAMRKRSRR